jgi:hypothetical protein
MKSYNENWAPIMSVWIENLESNPIANICIVAWLQHDRVLIVTMSDCARRNVTLSKWGMI